jgi:NADH-quinone oxidoreductase subunit A
LKGRETGNTDLLSDWGLIGLFLIVALLFVIMMATLPILLGKFGATPHNPNKAKNATYECGLETTGKSRFQFNFRYYCFAILFVTLDVMVVFLLPWAAGIGRLEGFGSFEGNALFALIGVGVFIAVLIVGYVYAWKKRLLEWM